jgi:hypothetical protein
MGCLTDPRPTYPGAGPAAQPIRRPDDTDARELLHQWVRDLRRGEDFYLHFHHFDLRRLLLQRTNAWIATELQHLADGQPDLLRITPTTYGEASTT